MTGVSFVFGAFSAISVFILLSFTRPAPQNPAGNEIAPVTVAEANAMLKAYLSTAVKPTVPVKGVFIDRQQLDAMNRLVGEMPSLPGFRIYFGKEKTGVQVGIVTGVDEKNLDVVSMTIYKTESPGTGPCPPNCDKESPIVKD